MTDLIAVPEPFGAPSAGARLRDYAMHDKGRTVRQLSLREELNMTRRSVPDVGAPICAESGRVGDGVEAVV